MQQPAFRVATTTNRAWNDHGNFRPDCDLLNPAARTTGRRRRPLRHWNNLNFGKSVVSTTYDPSVLNGWNIREYSWDLSVGVQQEIAPRTSVEVTYVRRSWGNQTVTDNRAVTAADFDRFSLTAPSDSRLPNGGGYRVEGIYELKPTKFGLVDNYITFAKNFGRPAGDLQRRGRQRERAAAGWPHAAGGLNIGQSALNDCDVVSQLPESLTAPSRFRTPESFCDQSSGWLKCSAL